MIQRDPMTGREHQVRRSIVGGLIGLAASFLVPLLLNGFNLPAAFSIWLPLLPAVVGVLLWGVWLAYKDSKRADTDSDARPG
jgi:hypothetical protein